MKFTALCQAGQDPVANNGAATGELEKVFCKDKFPHMRVIGQFNKGFILALLEHDIFILDQHACDERRNFEQLMNSYVMTKQPLLSPAPLHMSAVEESVVR